MDAKNKVEQIKLNIGLAEIWNKPEIKEEKLCGVRGKFLLNKTYEKLPTIIRLPSGKEFTIKVDTAKTVADILKPSIQKIKETYSVKLDNCYFSLIHIGENAVCEVIISTN